VMFAHLRRQTPISIAFPLGLRLITILGVVSTMLEAGRRKLVYAGGIVAGKITTLVLA